MPHLFGGLPRMLRCRVVGVRKTLSILLKETEKSCFRPGLIVIQMTLTPTQNSTVNLYTSPSFDSEGEIQATSIKIV